MATLQDLGDRVAAFPAAVKDAKIAQQLTNTELAEKSGVSASAVNKLLSGATSDPKLYNAVALYKTLGLSLDELFGLREPNGETREQLRDAELENAKLSAAADAKDAHLKSSRTTNAVMAALCIVLTLALIFYLAIDQSISDAGLIQYGNLSFFAWVLIGVIVAAAGITLFTILRILRDVRR